MLVYVETSQGKVVLNSDRVVEIVPSTNDEWTIRYEHIKGERKAYKLPLQEVRKLEVKSLPTGSASS